jgi:hypothetical protein
MILWVLYSDGFMNKNICYIENIVENLLFSLLSKDNTRISRAVAVKKCPERSSEKVTPVCNLFCSIFF